MNERDGYKPSDMFELPLEEEPPPERIAEREREQWMGELHSPGLSVVTETAGETTGALWLSPRMSLSSSLMLGSPQYTLSLRM